MAKLQNIRAITQMLEGTHRTQTKTKVGFSDADTASEKNKKREVGEIWEELDTEGNLVATWEQKKGYRVRRGALSEEIQSLREYLNTYPNCLDDCQTKNYDKLDERFRAKFGRCADCQFRIETRMKLNGTYKDYEREQMLANATAFFKVADVEIDLVASQLSKGLNYVNVDGAVETWEGNEIIPEKMRSEYEEYKQIVMTQLENYNK